jgi:hypothetical protein
MVQQVRLNAIENFRDYIGRYGSIVIAVILTLAFLDWYALQINTSMSEFNKLLSLGSIFKENSLTRIGATFGLVTALFAIGGIKTLKWISVISLPGFLFYHLYVIFNSSYSVFETNWEISYIGIISTILTLLPGVINLPTFFRHSRSRADSYLALTVMTIFITFFECSTIWMRFSGSEGISPYAILTTAYLFVMLICTNLLNIYLASACYETFMPRFEGTKGHAIMGLLGTLVYTFVQVSSPIEFLLDLFNIYIGGLGVVLLVSFLVRMIVKHRPRTFEKTINGAAWIVGCVVGTVMEFKHRGEGVNNLLVSISASVLFFLCVIFIEESIWAIRKLLSKTEDPYSARDNE